MYRLTERCLTQFQSTVYRDKKNKVLTFYEDSKTLIISGKICSLLNIYIALVCPDIIQKILDNTVTASPWYYWKLLWEGYSIIRSHHAA